MPHNPVSHQCPYCSRHHALLIQIQIKNNNQLPKLSVLDLSIPKNQTSDPLKKPGGRYTQHNYSKASNFFFLSKMIATLEGIPGIPLQK